MAGDQARPVVQPLTDFARLIGGRRLFDRLTRRPGDAADLRHARQLANPLRHLLQIGKGPRGAQVVWRVDDQVLGDDRVDREMVLQRGVAE